MISLVLEENTCVTCPSTLGNHITIKVYLKALNFWVLIKVRHEHSRNVNQ